MALQTPNLDDRKFQDIVSEARSKIPLYCPKWTDYNLSDPGITMIEMFAWMVDMLLYRLNRVPDKNYIKFMELIGIRLEPPKPAAVNVTFRLSAPQPEPVIIRQGTEIATIRTETEDAINFTTDYDFTILLPDMAYALTTLDEETFTDVMPALKNPDIPLRIFQEVPQANDAFYLGYHQDLSAHTLVLTIQSSVEGIGVDPHNPPWAWEFWDGEHERWAPMRLESDTTGGLNTNGQIIVHIPGTNAMREVNGQPATWIRSRATEPRPGQGAYSSSPKVRSVTSESIGCTIPSSQSFRVDDEFIGFSSGLPGQAFMLQNTPVLVLELGENVEVETEEEGEYEAWREVADFADSGPNDPHFTIDKISGEVRFGSSIRQPSGEERQYGSIPPNGKRIRFSSYRSGGGVIGNVGEGTISILKSSLPYIDTVTNFERAKGGVDAESMDFAKLRAPQVLRTNTRAVTKEDFEVLAIEASPKVVRARCISAGEVQDAKEIAPGTVRVLLIPAVPENEGRIPAEDLEVTRQVREDVIAFLDERRLLGVRLDIGMPKYIPVAVTAHIRVKRDYERQTAVADVEKRLYQYINPVCGGADGKGWPFGRSLNLSEIYACLQRVECVDYIEEVQIFPVDLATNQPMEATAKIDITTESVICSHLHEVTVVS
ncbi:putative baseplate assembly protein [Chloroflexota bacterium]